MGDKAFLSPGEVSVLLGVTRARVYQLISAGQIPAVRFGGAIRIPRLAWERWLQQRADQALAAVGQVLPSAPTKNVG